MLYCTIPKWLQTYWLLSSAASFLVPSYNQRAVPCPHLNCPWVSMDATKQSKLYLISYIYALIFACRIANVRCRWRGRWQREWKQSWDAKSWWSPWSARTVTSTKKPVPSSERNKKSKTKGGTDYSECDVRIANITIHELPKEIYETSFWAMLK